MATTQQHRTRYNYTKQERNCKGRFIAQHVRQPIATGDKYLMLARPEHAEHVLKALDAAIQKTGAEDRIGVRDAAFTGASGHVYREILIAGATPTELALLHTIGHEAHEASWRKQLPPIRPLVSLG